MSHCPVCKHQAWPAAVPELPVHVLQPDGSYRLVGYMLVFRCEQEECSVYLPPEGIPSDPGQG